MSARALALLIRAERRELERERQALTTAGIGLDQAEQTLRAQERRFEEEAALALAMPDGPRTCGGVRGGAPAPARAAPG